MSPLWFLLLVPVLGTLGQVQLKVLDGGARIDILTDAYPVIDGVYADGLPITHLVNITNSDRTILLPKECQWKQIQLTLQLKNPDGTPRNNVARDYYLDNQTTTSLTEVTPLIASSERQFYIVLIFAFAICLTACCILYGVYSKSPPKVDGEYKSNKMRDKMLAEELELY